MLQDRLVWIIVLENLFCFCGFCGFGYVGVSGDLAGVFGGGRENGELANKK